ncbi:MAG: putative secondary metabolism biosynthetic enzyme [Alyxoria varia]|nr:MAG: putative secondary metabolism biosynthetic enzyme [Alyxoria varia]
MTFEGDRDETGVRYPTGPVDVAYCLRAAAEMPETHSHFANGPDSLFDEAIHWKGTTSFTPREQMRNVLVTGGAGFIASWFTRHLTLTYARDYDIVVIDNLEYAGSINNIRCLQSRPNFHFVFGDIRRREDVEYCVKRFSVDTIVNFAAHSQVGNSFSDPLGFTINNVLGTQIVADVARTNGIKRFIHFSTDEVYGDLEGEKEYPRGFKECAEDSPLRPKNPYAASKAAAEMMLWSYAHRFELPLITVRSNNVYGPCQYPEKIIPRFVLLLSQNKMLPLHGDGSNARRYLYASDVADAVDTILHKGRVGEAYNIASQSEVSNLEICKALLRRFGIAEKNLDERIQHVSDRPQNDLIYTTNGNKLRQLGWEPKTKFEDGMAETVDWYRTFGTSWWGGVDNALTGSAPGITDKNDEHTSAATDGNPDATLVHGLRGLAGQVAA